MSRQEAAETPQQANLQESVKISDELLIKVSDKVSTKHGCERLAAFLEVGLATVESAHEAGIKHPNELALYVLREWEKIKGSRATVKNLLKALSKDVKLHDLIEPLEEHQRTAGVTTKKRRRTSSDSGEEPSRKVICKALGITCSLELKASKFLGIPYEQIQSSLGHQFSARFSQPVPDVKIEAYAGDGESCVLKKLARMNVGVTEEWLQNRNQTVVKKQFEESLGVVLGKDPSEFEVLLLVKCSLSVFFLLPEEDANKLDVLWQDSPAVVQHHFQPIFGPDSKVESVSSVFGSSDWRFVEPPTVNRDVSSLTGCKTSPASLQGHDMTSELQEAMDVSPPQTLNNSPQQLSTSHPVHQSEFAEMETLRQRLSVADIRHESVESTAQELSTKDVERQGKGHLEAVSPEGSKSSDSRSQSSFKPPPIAKRHQVSDIVEQPTRVQEQGEESTLFSETWIAVEKARASAQADAQWLSANRRILLENNLNIPAMDVVDHIISSSRGQFLDPSSEQHQIISTRVTSRDKLRALLNMLTPTLAVNNVPHFKLALNNVCPRVLENCIDVQSTMVSMRADLDQHYRQEYDKEKIFYWLDDQGERPTTYIPNTCLIEKDEAQQMMMERMGRTHTGLAYTAHEQGRRDYIYAKPSKEKLVRLEYLYQRSTNTANRHLTLVSAEGAPSAAPTVTETLPQSSSASTQAMNTDIDPSLRSRLARAKRVGIYAGAGCGKSCYCINIATFYLQHWSVFDVVLFWRLREPTVQKAKTLEELLCALHPSWTTIRAQQLSAALLATAGRGVLAVLDGIDELEADEYAYIWLVLEGKVLGEARLLVTSRPCALAKSILDTYDINLELLGFTEDQVSEFVYQRLGDDLAPKLSRFLDENERLASLMYVPLIALFVCEVFRQTPESPPSTRTALYCKLLALLVRRSVGEHRVHLWHELDDIMLTFDVRDFIGKAKSLLLELSRLAQMAQDKGKVIFGRQLVKAAKCSDDALRLGLVGRKSGKAEPQYSFQHLTVQEFLVAFGLSESINSEHLPPSPSTATCPAANSATDTSALATDEEQRSACAADTVHREGTVRMSRLMYVLKRLLSMEHLASVVIQFLAGQVSRDLLPEFFLTLNEWLHEHWCADPDCYGEKEEEAESRRRLLTCLECVKEAFPDEDDDFPDALQLFQTVSLRHTKAADLSLLAKAIKKSNDIRKLMIEFDYEKENEQREDDKSSRVRTQRRRAMTVLLRGVWTCECVEALKVYGPSRRNVFFDPEGWRVLCDVVQHTSLKELYVQRCGLGNCEAIELATSLRKNKTLTRLSLWWNNISEGVCVLADVLERNETLEWLELDYNSYEKSTGDRLRLQLQHICYLSV